MHRPEWVGIILGPLDNLSFVQKYAGSKIHTAIENKLVSTYKPKGAKEVKIPGAGRADYIYNDIEIYEIKPNTQYNNQNAKDQLNNYVENNTSMDTSILVGLTVFGTMLSSAAGIGGEITKEFASAAILMIIPTPVLNQMNDKFNCPTES